MATPAKTAAAIVLFTLTLACDRWEILTTYVRRDRPFEERCLVQALERAGRRVEPQPTKDGSFFAWVSTRSGTYNCEQQRSKEMRGPLRALEGTLFLCDSPVFGGRIEPSRLAEIARDQREALEAIVKQCGRPPEQIWCTWKYQDPASRCPEEMP
jgi:hypothetical protein